MSESIVLEIDGNLYPLASLFTAQDSSRLQESSVAERVRHRINNSYFDGLSEELIASAGLLFSSDITPWQDYYGDDNTPMAHVDDCISEAIFDIVHGSVRSVLLEPIRTQADELTKQVFGSAVQDILTAQANTFISWRAASEYARRALRGEGIKPTIDGQQLLANFEQQCQEICSLVDTHIPPEPQ